MPIPLRLVAYQRPYQLRSTLSAMSRPISPLLAPLSLVAAILFLLPLMNQNNKATTTTGSVAHGYCTGDLNRRDIAGVWSLKSQSFLPTLHPPAPTTGSAKGLAAADAARMQKRPLKEFTKWPKIKKKKMMAKIPAIEEEELLLMLRDDGSFVQYGKIAPDDVPGEDDEADAKKQQQQQQQQGTVGSSGSGSNPAFGRPDASRVDQEGDADDDATDGVMKGTWDFLDGRLILAADRPQDIEDLRNIQHDTILVGDVVVRSEVSLDDRRAGLLDKDSSVGRGDGAATSASTTNSAAGNTNEPERSSDKKSKKSKNSSSSDKIAATASASTDDDDDMYDVHISVPEGTVEIGKFMYPKKHPSFFEQPIYKPTPTGSFQLRQVLGSLNTRTKKKDDEPVEKFKLTDLQGKRYFLTTYPLKDRSKKKKIEDVKPHERAEVERRRAEEEARPVPIRAVEIELYPNMTFSTIGGLGDSKILRGKWSIIGSEKDQLWMQVFRFGFGRSVSGSTFSEGVGLTHDDQKAYWGRILDVNEATDANNTQAKATPTTASTESAGDPDEPKTVEINGSVLDGWGLEPLPVARFTMIEETQEYDGDEEDGMDDDDDEEEMFRQSLEKYADFGDGGRGGGSTDDDADPFSSADAFQ